MSYYARIKAMERKQTKQDKADFRQLDLLGNYMQGKVTEDEYQRQQAALPKINAIGDFSKLDQIARELEREGFSYD